MWAGRGKIKRTYEGVFYVRTRASSMYRTFWSNVNKIKFGKNQVRSARSATALTELAPITSDQIKSDEVRAQDSKSKSRYNMATYEGTGMSMSMNMSRTNLNTT